MDTSCGVCPHSSHSVISNATLHAWKQKTCTFVYVISMHVGRKVIPMIYSIIHGLNVKNRGNISFSKKLTRIKMRGISETFTNVEPSECSKVLAVMHIQILSTQKGSSSPIPCQAMPCLGEIVGKLNRIFRIWPDFLFIFRIPTFRILYKSLFTFFYFSLSMPRQRDGYN